MEVARPNVLLSEWNVLSERFALPVFSTSIIPLDPITIQLISWCLLGVLAFTILCIVSAESLIEGSDVSGCSVATNRDSFIGITAIISGAVRHSRVANEGLDTLKSKCLICCALSGCLEGMDRS